MQIQSCSIVVPTKGCVNKCKFCVSRMHENPYVNSFDEFQITKRIKWAVMNGINTCIITGTGEALQNTKFLEKLAKIFKKLDHPFPNVELQTSGVMLMDFREGNIEPFVGEKFYDNIELLKELGVNTISVSVSNIFNSARNWDIIDASEKFREEIGSLCRFIKEQGFNLRLSLNLTNIYDDYTPLKILSRCSELGADQVTFRKLYASDLETEQSKWVKENACKESTFDEIRNFIVGKTIINHGSLTSNVSATQYKIKGQGTPLYNLPFGATVYSIMGMSTVIDTNCMAKNEDISLKYVILRENGKLYSQWDDIGSLIF